VADAVDEQPADAKVDAMADPSAAHCARLNRPRAKDRTPAGTPRLADPQKGQRSS
jgi:hypothetical protein